ncbi:MAG: aminoacyl-tRNA hydrolase [Flavobacteriia bacterium]|nr:aminoacyl-tRNA hydrolase [Flavobacteriia bacterium]
MKHLIVGLGNPGDEYSNTRHNIGFKIADYFSNEHQVTFSLQKLANVCELSIKGNKIILIKPNTYMNLSGKAVNYWMQKEKIPVEQILVITDDIALPFGKLRMKGKGSAGGHNGLSNIENTLQTNNYSRLRFGIGNEFHKGKQVDYVLGEWSDYELETLNERIKLAYEFCKLWVLQGTEKAMNQMNNS